MSRLAKTVVVEREDFVRNLFRENLRLTGLEVQTKLRETFGKMMRPNRIYELKRDVALEVLGNQTAIEAATTTVTEVPTTTPEVAVVPTVTVVDSVSSVG